MKKFIEMLHSSIQLQSNEGSSGHSELIGSVFFVFIASLLTAVNIIKHVDLTMTIATTVLIIGFSLSAFLASRRFLMASRIVIMLMCGGIFSMFALIAGNDGFAILWILLVPVIGAMWIGVKYGIILSSYFQLFLIVLFYTPMSSLVKDYYTATFMLRFPMLYLACFGSITFLMWQRENLMKRLYHESYFDALTGLHNRRYFNECADKIKSGTLNPGLTIFSFDLNRLKYANDNFGHQAGDEILKAAADIIGKNFKGADCFRTGGDEFIALATRIDAEKAVANMNKDIAAWHGEIMDSISISVGYASVKEHPEMNFDELLVLADEKMYKDKTKFYKDNGLEKR